jgi:hypothetical protein
VYRLWKLTGEPKREVSKISLGRPQCIGRDSSSPTDRRRRRRRKKKKQKKKKKKGKTGDIG